MAQTETSNGVQADSDYASWANRLGTLLNYRGPIPNGTVDGQQTHFIGTGYDLSGVIKAVVFIDQDWRYGFDGPVGSNPGFEFPSMSGWFVNSEISNYPNGRAALCSVLATSGFSITCTHS